MYSQCVISVFVALYITATGHTKVLHILKIILSAITLVFPEPLMTSNRYPAERFGRAQNGPTFDRQNTIFAASKPVDEIASGRLNPNICDHWGINKDIRQNYFLVHIHFKRQFIWISSGLVQPCLNGIYPSPLHRHYPQLMIDY